MKIDEQTFARNITLKICGSLDSEKALWQSLMYLREFMPVVRITLHTFDPASRMAETVAYANPSSSVVLSVKTELSPKASRLMMDNIGIQSVRIVRKTLADPVLGPIARDLKQSDAEGVIMNLVLDGELLGFLVITAEEGKTIQEEHTRLLALTGEPYAVALANSIRFREVLDLKDRLEDQNRYYQGELRRVVGQEIIGMEQGLQGVMELVQRVAPLFSPVLLLGETGVGKELIANAIHNSSGRGHEPFIKVNCGAIPETLIDSELFGHEKGAFTGALALKRGRFERANRGTVFLDEIGELPLEAQVRLLRVLQEKIIERVGSTRSIHLDIRIIAATHRNLEEMISKGTFREDLYFRLSVFPILIPPLRNRVADIPALVNHFMFKKSREMGVGNIPILSAGAVNRLMSYSWPGNVRELENAVERELILCQGQPLAFGGIPNGASVEACPQECPLERGIGTVLHLDTIVADHIRKVLKLCNGRVEGNGGAAEALGVNPGTLRARMKKLDISFGRKASRL